MNYVHDKEERKDLLDGTGEGFPTPPAANPEGPDLKSDLDPEAWLEKCLILNNFIFHIILTRKNLSLT